jgi:serine/threonine-protein kinase
MDTDRNLLFGILALQADLIDAGQFVEACTLWASHKNMPLAELLLERRWIQPADKAHVDYLLERKLLKHGGDPQASLASVPNDIKRTLAALDAPDIQRSLAELPGPDHASAGTTIDHVPQHGERYTLIRLHGRGGIGQVWLARDTAMGRHVALKELRPDKAENPVVQARFLKEAHITGRLEHPGIIPVYEVARRGSDQHPFYTMRFVKGRTLTEAARAYHQKQQAGQADSFDQLALLNAFVTVCHTVAYAHARGVIHRDLTGQNVVLGDFGEVIVLDWGLAKLTGHHEAETDVRAPDLEPDELGTPDLTVQGQALGTPAYMAPEQAAGRLDLIGRHTDVYGLGAILFEILTGQPPFFGSDIHEVLCQVREQDPIPPRRFCPDVPPALEAICLQALAKRPEDRCAGAGELAQQVRHWLAELAERQQADRQQARFFALSPDLMCIAGFDGYFKQLNPAWEKCLGWTIEELQARSWIDFVHTDDVAPTVAAVEKIIAGKTCLFHENRYRCKDGSYRWLQWTAQEIVGQQLIYAVARDITERKQAAEALRESEERYRSVVAAMQDGIVLLDADGSIRACNASAERILGLSADQMMGRTPLDPRWGAICEDGSPFPDDARPPVVTLRTGLPCSNVIMGVRRPDGALTWLSVNSQPLFHTNGTTLAGVVACFADITDRRRTEEALRQTTLELIRLRQQPQQDGVHCSRDRGVVAEVPSRSVDVAADPGIAPDRGGIG